LQNHGNSPSSLKGVSRSADRPGVLYRGTYVIRALRDKIATERCEWSRGASVKLSRPRKPTRGPAGRKRPMTALPSLRDRAFFCRLYDMEGRGLDESIHLPCP
jgi:hypothetical protein